MPQTAVAKAPAVGRAGEPADQFTASDGQVVSATSEESSAEIPFGLMVQATTTNSEYGAKLITGTGNKLLGVVVRSHDFAEGTDIGSTGLKPGATFGVARSGRWFVTIEENVTPTSAVRVRCAGTGTIGAFRATADSTNCLDLSPFAKWVRTSLAADGVGELEFEMTNAALAVAG